MLCHALLMWAQPRFSKAHGLYEDPSISVSITPSDAAAQVRYTLDGSEPTPQSKLYSTPLTLKKTTL